MSRDDELTRLGAMALELERLRGVLPDSAAELADLDERLAAAVAGLKLDAPEEPAAGEVEAVASELARIGAGA